MVELIKGFVVNFELLLNVNAQLILNDWFCLALTRALRARRARPPEVAEII